MTEAPVRLRFHDLLSFGLPVLFVGDHGQLEPIGTSAGLMADPHVRLETIHRQARGNPILRLATALREGRPTPYWDDPRGRLRVLGGRFGHVGSSLVSILARLKVSATGTLGRA